MARVTVEDCLEKVENRFALVHLAAERARELRHEGVDPLVHSTNKSCVSALREVAAGHVYFEREVADVIAENHSPEVMEEF
jgi:DNA-directed RNA polymerase subunit omega